MLLLALAVMAVPHAEGGGVETPILPPNTYLVKARVVRVDEARGYAADFVIEKVYAGDSALKGHGFTLSDYYPLRNGSQSNRSLPPRVQGEVGLWWVGREPAASSDPGEDDAKLFSHNDRTHRMPSIYYPFPAILKGGKGPYRLLFPSGGDLDLTGDPYDFGPDRMVQWAEAIGKVYATRGDEERITLLKKLASADNAPLSGWAIYTLSCFLEEDAKSQLFTPQGKVCSNIDLALKLTRLGKRVRKDVKSMLEDFADDAALSIYAQTELDRVLTRIEGDDWLTSDRRKTMLQRWKEVKDPVDRYFIGVRLDQKGASR